MSLPTDREAIGELDNPLGLDGIEFVEYATSRPQALGQVLERMGFRPVARHRSREVLLYRQGDMNIVVNAQPAACRGGAADERRCIAAFALRVRDAGAAHRRALERGAWAVPTACRGDGAATSRPSMASARAASTSSTATASSRSTTSTSCRSRRSTRIRRRVAGMHWFGLVQYIGIDRSDDWTEFYRELFGFARAARRPALRHPAQRPAAARAPAALSAAARSSPSPTRRGRADEALQRVGFGVPDVLAAVSALRERGVEFVETERRAHPRRRGALTRTPSSAA